MANVIFSFDELSILSCNGKNEVILKCKDGDFEDCILYVPRPLFLKMVNEWLDHKQSYNKTWKGEFCGVGYLRVGAAEISYKKESDRPFLVDYVKDGEELNKKIKRVRGFIALNFIVEMEHG